MKKDELLYGNLYAKCNKQELINLWYALEDFYEKGYVPSGSVLEPYRKAYTQKFPTGIIEMEKDLLRAIAVKFIKEEN